jgi:hypothetical protein
MVSPAATGRRARPPAACQSPGKRIEAIRSASHAPRRPHPQDLVGLDRLPRRDNAPARRAHRRRRACTPRAGMAEGPAAGNRWQETARGTSAMARGSRPACDVAPERRSTERSSTAAPARRGDARLALDTRWSAEPVEKPIGDRYGVLGRPGCRRFIEPMLSEKVIRNRRRWQITREARRDPMTRLQKPCGKPRERASIDRHHRVRGPRSPGSMPE